MVESDEAGQVRGKPTHVELERAIASVPGVEEAHVTLLPDTGRSRLRIRLANGEDAPTVSWAIAATLRERFGIVLDPGAIRPRLSTTETPPDDAGTSQEPREPGEEVHEVSGTVTPDEPGTVAPDEPGTTAPDEPGTTAPDEPGTVGPAELADDSVVVVGDRVLLSEAARAVFSDAIRVEVDDRRSGRPDAADDVADVADVLALSEEEPETTAAEDRPTDDAAARDAEAAEAPPEGLASGAPEPPAAKADGEDHGADVPAPEMEDVVARGPTASDMEGAEAPGPTAPEAQDDATSEPTAEAEDRETPPQETLRLVSEEPEARAAGAPSSPPEPDAAEAAADAWKSHHRAWVVTDPSGAVPGQESPRAAIRHLDTRIDVSDVRVTATLAHAGRVVTGEARSVPTRQGILRAVAEATLTALRALTNERLVVGIDSVVASVAGEPPMATVLVGVITERGEETLLGSSLARDDPERAVMRATLDALNRRVEPWLEVDLAG